MFVRIKGALQCILTNKSTTVYVLVAKHEIEEVNDVQCSGEIDDDIVSRITIHQMSTIFGSMSALKTMKNMKKKV